jgi:hypothetical protein
MGRWQYGSLRSDRATAIGQDLAEKSDTRPHSPPDPRWQRDSSHINSRYDLRREQGY